MEIIIAVGSTNPSKLTVAKQAFQKVFPENTINIVPVKAPSKVSDQPRSLKEVRTGALNRLEYVIENTPSDYCIAMEGGIIDSNKHMKQFAYIVACDPLKRDFIARMSTIKLRVPEPIAELVRNGMEMGPAADKIFGTKNCKEDGGMLKLITNGALSREEIYLHAAILAINQLKNPEWFPIPRSKK